METPDVLETRIAEIIRDGAKKARNREIWRAILIAAIAATAIFAWELLLRGAGVVAALY